MTLLAKPFKSITTQSLDILLKIRKVLIGLSVLSLGILLGYLFNLSQEAAALIASLLVIFILLLVILSRPLYGFLALVFFITFIDSWVEIPMGAGIPDLSFSRFAVAFLLVSMLALAAIGKFHFARISLTDIFIVIVPIAIMTAAPKSIDPQPKGVIQWALTMHLTPLIAYFFAKNLVRDRKDLHNLFLIIALLGLASGLYAAYEFATGNVLFLSKGTEDVGALYRGDTGIRQIRGLWGSTGNMGRALVATIPVTFYLFLERKRYDLSKILLVGMLVVQFYGLVLSMARSPWYALLIALFIMQIFYPQFRKVFIAIALVAAIVIWATWDQVAESQVATRVNDENSTLEGREARWQAGYNMWQAKPILGWGFGRFKDESRHFRTDGIRKNFRDGAVENDYLYIMIGSGLVGLVPYVIFLLIPLVNSLRLFYRARAPGWSGFIKPQTLTVYWAVLICLVMTSYTAKQTAVGIKLTTFAVAGAVVGSQEYLLRGAKSRARREAQLPQQVIPNS